MLTFRSTEEQAAWMLAEALTDKALVAMRNAEEAAEILRSGKAQTRQQFKQKGLSEADADIRWNATARARKAASDNEWFRSHSTMYSGAAAAQYARALYLAQRDRTQ